MRGRGAVENRANRCASVNNVEREILFVIWDTREPIFKFERTDGHAIAAAC
jgi:hypothetical protein